jgi:hypothetical protein
MRTVRDDAGHRYLLEKESDGSALVRDPSTGERTHVPTEELVVVDGEKPLATAARAVPRPVRRAVTAARDERALGLLVDIHRRGPVGVRTLLETTECCESDIHGLLAEFVTAGLLEDTEVLGERGYETTEDGETALAVLTAAGQAEDPD